MPVSTPAGRATLQVMPDDHSKSVPPLPIPNRTVKRLCADDSAATSVKVGYRQASYKAKPAQLILSGLFAFEISIFTPILTQNLTVEVKCLYRHLINHLSD